jgi:hypothetical protein
MCIWVSLLYIWVRGYESVMIGAENKKLYKQRKPNSDGNTLQFVHIRLLTMSEYANEMFVGNCFRPRQ